MTTAFGCYTYSYQKVTGSMDGWICYTCVPEFHQADTPWQTRIKAANMGTTHESQSQLGHPSWIPAPWCVPVRHSGSQAKKNTGSNPVWSDDWWEYKDNIISSITCQNGRAVQGARLKICWGNPRGFESHFWHYYVLTHCKYNQNTYVLIHKMSQ